MEYHRTKNFMNLTNILYILDNCDSLIENNFKKF